MRGRQVPGYSATNLRLGCGCRAPRRAGAGEDQRAPGSRAEVTRRRRHPSGAGTGRECRSPSPSTAAAPRVEHVGELLSRVQPRQLHSPVVLGDLALDLPVRVRIVQAPAVGEGEVLLVRAVPAGERVVDSVSELLEGVAARGREDPSWPRPVLLAEALDQLDPDRQPGSRQFTPPVRSNPARPWLADTASPVITGGSAKAHPGCGPSRSASSWHTWRTGTPGSASGGADISDRCVQGVLPEVIGLPPGDLVKQVRLCSAAQRRSCQDRELKLMFCRPRKAHSGRNRSRIPSKASGSARLAPHQSSTSAATWRKTSPGKVLFRGCRAASSPASSGTPRSGGQPVQQDPAGGGRVLGRGQVPGRHTQTVGQNRSGRLVFGTLAGRAAATS